HGISIDVVPPMGPSDKSPKIYKGVMALARTVAELVQVPLDIVGTDFLHARIAEPEVLAQASLIALVGALSAFAFGLCEIFLHRSAPTLGDWTVLTECVLGQTALCLCTRLCKREDADTPNGFPSAASTVH